VAIPPHILPAVADHLAEHVGPGPDALLFPSAYARHIATATVYAAYFPAREAAGRPDLRFHDLRHTGATLAAQTGATLADLMNRLGHSTVGAAMRYQHTTRERDAMIAERMTAQATAANVTPIGSARSARKAGA
jgi:integrase